MTDFGIMTLYLVVLYLISSRSFYVDFLGFSMNIIMLSANTAVFLFSLFTFMSFPGHIMSPGCPVELNGK